MQYLYFLRTPTIAAIDLSLHFGLTDLFPIQVKCLRYHEVTIRLPYIF